MSPADLQSARRDGADALRQGRPQDALACFQQIIDQGRPDPAVWIAAAMARGMLGDRPGELAALQEALKLNPRDARALLMCGDNHTASGDNRAAQAYYQAFLRLAATTGDMTLRAELPRVRQLSEANDAAFSGHLEAALQPLALDQPHARRMQRALNILLGRSELYLQQPKAFYFPELPNVEYAEREWFPWLGRVEAATDDIRRELLGVLQDEGAFAPYIEAEPNRPFFDNGLLGNPDWSAFYLWKSGVPVAENAARCPATMAALAEAPLCRIPGRTPSILFSLLRPGMHIQPHTGFMNSRYICHLPLIVPDGCAMRVGSQTRTWVEGQACVFDDSIEHEAWNKNPDHLRVVLIFDVWRPELTEAERVFVSSALQAVDSYGRGGETEPGGL